METPNQLHLTIEQLEDIVDQAKSLRHKHKDRSPIVRITKTASRQDLRSTDKIELDLLMSSSTTENHEG